MLCMAAYWFSGEIRAGLVFPQALMLLAPALYGANRLFLRRQRSLRALVLANLALCVACFLGLALSIGPDERLTLAVAAALCAFLTVQAARLAITPPALSRVILCLDASLVALALFVAYAAGAQIPAYQMLPAAVGCAGSLLGLMVCRTGGNLGARGWLFAAAVFGLILLCVLLLWALVAAPVGQGVVAVFGALSAAVRFLCALLARAAAWFVSLFPEEATGGLEWEQDMGGLPQAQAEVQQVAQASPAAMAAVGLVLLAALVLLVGWGMHLLGRIRLGGTGVFGAAGPARTRMTLAQGLRRLFASFAARVRLRIWLFQNRNTPKGLYYLLVRRCRMGPVAQAPRRDPEGISAPPAPKRRGGCPASSGAGRAHSRGGCGAVCAVAAQCAPFGCPPDPPPHGRFGARPHDPRRPWPASVFKGAGAGRGRKSA